MTALIFRSKSADCDALISLAILPKISVSRKDKSDSLEYFSHLIIFWALPFELTISNITSANRRR